MRKIEQHRQPELFAQALALTLTWLEMAPPDLQLGENAMALTIAALAAVVDTLDEAARSGS